MGGARTPRRTPAAGRVLGIDHVAIVVRSIEASIPLYRRVLGVEARPTEDYPEHGVRVALFVLGEGRIELLEPLGGTSPIAKFLETRGEGLHHVSLAVDDIAAALARLDASGVPLIDRAARPGAEGKLVAFVHPRGAGGILFELSEDPARRRRPARGAKRGPKRRNPGSG